MMQEPYPNPSETFPQGKMPPRQPKWGRWLLIALGAVVLLLVVVTAVSFLMRSHQLQQHLELG